MASEFDLLAENFFKPANSSSKPRDGYLDYVQNFDAEKIRENPYFLDDLRKYYATRGGDGKTDDELVTLWLDDSNLREINTFAPYIGARGSLADIADDSDEDKARLGRLKQAAEQMPFFWQDGGRGVVEAAPSIAKAIVTDPTNLLGAAGGFMKGARVVKGAVDAGQALSRGARIAKGAGAGLKTGALIEGGIGAAAGAIQSAGDQEINVQLGIQDEVSTARIFEEAVLSGAIAGTVGAFIGGLGGAIGAERMGQHLDALKSLGYSEAQILDMPVARAIHLSRDRVAPPPDQIVADAEEAAIQSLPPEKQAEAVAARNEKKRREREQLRLNSIRDALRSANEQYQKDLEESLGDAVDPRYADRISERITETRRLIDFHERMDKERAEIDELLFSNDPKKIQQGEVRSRQYEEDLAKMRALAEQPVPEDIRAWIDEMNAREDARAKAELEAKDGGKKTSQQAESSESNETPAQETAETPSQEAAESTDATQSDDLADFLAEPAPAKPKAPKRVRDFALTQNVDLADVTPTGKNGTVTITDVRNFIESNGASQRITEFEDALNEAAVYIETNFSQFPDLVGRLQTDSTALARFVASMKGIKDESHIGDLVEYINSLRSRADDVPVEGQPIKFTDSEKRFIRRRVSELKKNNPILPDVAARDLAEQAVIRAREVPDTRTRETKAPRNQTPEQAAQYEKAQADAREFTRAHRGLGNYRSTEGATERARQNPVAGRTNSGRIQSFLRSGRSFIDEGGDEYSITGRATGQGKRAATVGDIPTAGTLSFEEAVLMSQGSTEPVAFIADTTIPLADSTKPGSRGEILWVDPNSGKPFRNWRNILNANGTLDQYTSFPAFVNRQLESLTRRGSTAEASLKSPSDIMDMMIRGEITPTEMAARLNALKNPGASSAAAPDLPPLQRDGKLLVLTRRDGTAKRIASQQDIADGLTAQDIIGHNQNIDDWQAFYVPPETPNTQTGVTMATAQAAPEPPAERFVFRGAMPVDKFRAARLSHDDLTDLDWRILDIAAAIQTNPRPAQDYIANARKKRSGISGEVLARLSANIEGGQTRAMKGQRPMSSRWPADNVGRRKLIEVIKGLQDLQARIAPDGVTLPEADRKAAINEIHAVFSPHGPEQLEIARDFIEQLNSRALPVFSQTSGDGVATTDAVSLSADRVGKITFGKDFKSKTEMPQIATLFHEMAHWAYLNVLTPAERLQFWDAMGKYYDENGTFNPRELVDRSPIAMVKGKLYGPSNAIDSPAEFFANQFAMYASQTVAPESMRTIWGRVAKIIKAIFDRFFSNKSIDPDLEPLFARLLGPDERKAVEIQASAAPNQTDDLASFLAATNDISDPSPVTSPTVSRKTGKRVITQSETQAPVDTPKSTQSRSGPDRDYLGEDTLDELIETALPQNERWVTILNWNYQLINDIESAWNDAVRLDDPHKAVDAARQTIQYLRGSVLTRKQAEIMVRAAAAASGTAPQQVRTRKVFDPYNARNSRTGKQGTLAAHGRNKIHDLVSILSGKDVVGIEDIDDADSMEGALRTASASIGALEESSYSVSQNLDVVGRRLIELYSLGKKLPTGERRKGSSMQDWFNLARKALNTSYERKGLRPWGVSSQGSQKYVAAKDAVFAAIGKWSNVRPGDIYSPKGERTNYRVTGFEENADGFRIARMQSEEGDVLYISPDNSTDYVRISKAPKIEQIVERATDNVTSKVRREAKARAETVDAATKRATGRSSNDQKPEAFDLNTKTLAEEYLGRVVANNPDGSTGRKAASELVSKESARPIINKSSRQVSYENVTELAEMVDESFRHADEDMDDYAAALFAENGGNPVLSFSSTDAISAIEREKAAHARTTSENGIPGNIHSDLRELLLGIQHRNARKEYNARTLAYRLLNLMDRNNLTDGDIADALNHKSGVLSTTTFSTSSPIYSNFRNRIRSIGDALAGKGDTEIKAAISDLVSILMGIDANGVNAVRNAFDDKAEAALRGKGYEANRKAAEFWLQQAIDARLTTTKQNVVTPPPTNTDAREVAHVRDFVNQTLDNLAYVTNGLIGSSKEAGPVRDYLRRLTWYGDPFIEKAPPNAMLTNDVIMTPSRARFAADEVSSNPAMRAAVSAFLGKDFNKVKVPVYYYHLPVGSRVTDFRSLSIAETSGEFGSGIYIDRYPSSGANAFHVADSVANIADAENRFEAEVILRELQETTVHIDSAFQNKSPEGVETLLQYLDREEALIEYLRDLGASGLKYAVPVMARMKTPLNIEGSIRDTDTLGLFREAFSRYIDGTGITTAQLDQAVANFQKVHLNGDVASGKVSALLHEIARQSSPKKVSALLRQAGYDSLISKDTVVIFDADNVRTTNDPALRTPISDDATDARLSPSGPLVTRLLTNNEENIPVEKMPLILGPISRAEPVRQISDTVGNMLKGRAPTESDMDGVVRLHAESRLGQIKSVTKGALRSNSNTFRKLGMHWLADHFETVFPEMTQTTSRLLNGTIAKPGPLAMINSLPDSKGAVKGALRRWYRRSTADLAGTRKFGADQPDSHKRIIAALRRNDKRAWGALSDEETNVAKSIREHLRSTLEELRAHGVDMGDLGDDYFPQVWSATEIRNNKNEFIAAMEQFLEADYKSTGRDADMKEIRTKAVSLYNRMSDSEFEGLFSNTMGNSRKSAGENLDYSRVLRVNQSDSGLALRRFLEPDLEAVLIKYYDQAGRRLKQVEKFGNLSHGAYDYLKVIEDGVEGIASLLSTRRTFKRSAKANIDGQYEDIVIETDYPMPFESNEFRAREAAKKVTEIFIDPERGPTLAREYLMQIAPIDRRTGSASMPYLRRVDAILAALDDFEGVPQQITSDARVFIDNMMRVGNRKSISDHRLKLSASRFVRNFNSLTLLGFTTLTSIGDPALPIIRSGNMKAAYRAYASMAKDPVYRQMITNIGAAMESTLHDRLSYLWGAADGRFTNAFFSVTGLTPWTDVQRKLAAAIGLETFKAMQAKARAYDPSKSLNEQPRQFKQAYRMLKMYGLEEFATIRRDVRLDSPDIIENTEALRTAIIRFADDSIFAPNPNDIPIWGQTPLGAVVFQLKSFPLMMMRMAKEVMLNDVRLAAYDMLGRTPPQSLKGTGDLRRAAWFLTLGPALAGIGLATKDVVQGRGDDVEENPHSVRTRRAHQWFGQEEEWDDEALDMYLGWYLESFTMMGGMGLMLEMIHDILGQADNGAYGMVRTASVIAGPTASALAGGFNVGAGALDVLLDSTPDSNSKERLAVREIAQRVPILGGLRPFREDVVNNAAGEKARRDAQRAAKAGKAPDFSKIF